MAARIPSNALLRPSFPLPIDHGRTLTSKADPASSRTPIVELVEQLRKKRPRSIFDFEDREPGFTITTSEHFLGPDGHATASIIYELPPFCRIAGGPSGKQEKPRALQMIQDKACCASNGPILSKQHNPEKLLFWMPPFVNIPPNHWEDNLFWYIAMKQARSEQQSESTPREMNR